MPPGNLDPLGFDMRAVSMHNGFLKTCMHTVLSITENLLIVLLSIQHAALGIDNRKSILIKTDKFYRQLSIHHIMLINYQV